jgi:hypothetical protein
MFHGSSWIQSIFGSPQTNKYVAGFFANFLFIEKTTLQHFHAFSTTHPVAWVWMILNDVSHRSAKGATRHRNLCHRAGVHEGVKHPGSFVPEMD